MNQLTTEKTKELLKSGKKVSEIARKYKISRQAVYYHTDKLKRKNRKKKFNNNDKQKINYNSRINWKIYNDGLVKRGEILFDLDVFKNWNERLKRMNQNKVGLPYRYPETFILILLRLKSIFQIDYRTLEGIAKKLLLFIPECKQVAPDYTTLHSRLKKGNYKLEIYQKKEEQIVAGDSSGLKTNKRGEYRMNQKKGKEKKKYVKLHISVNIKTKQVIAEVITDDGVSDSQKMKQLLDDAEAEGPIKKALFDKAYDGESNHWLLKNRGIEDGIKPRESLSLKRTREEISGLVGQIKKWEKRGKDVEKYTRRLFRLKILREYLTNKKSWAKKRDYGQRWQVEIRYSVFKRLFGDHVYSKNMNCINKEIRIKTNLMNLFTSILTPAVSG